MPMILLRESDNCFSSWLLLIKLVVAVVGDELFSGTVGFCGLSCLFEFLFSEYWPVGLLKSLTGSPIMKLSGISSGIGSKGVKHVG